MGQFAIVTVVVPWADDPKCRHKTKIVIFRLLCFTLFSKSVGPVHNAQHQNHLFSGQHHRSDATTHA